MKRQISNREPNRALHAPRSTLHARWGQSMLLTVLALGGMVLGATTIAGLLTVYQIRQTTDLANSAKAFFAADTGIEWGLYQFFKPEGAAAAPEFSNGALSPHPECRDAVDVPVPCTDPSTASIRSVGRSANAHRALHQFLQEGQ